MYILSKENIFANVHKENEARKVLQALYVRLREVFLPYKGQKVVLKAGGWIKPLAERVREVQDTLTKAIVTHPEGPGKYANVHIVGCHPHYSTCFLSVSICFQKNDVSCEYTEVSRWFVDFEPDTGILREVSDVLDALPVDPEAEYMNYLEYVDLKERIANIERHLLSEHRE